MKNLLTPSMIAAVVIAFATGVSDADDGQKTQGVNVLNVPLPVQVVNPSSGSSVTISNSADIAKAMGIGQPVHFSAVCSTPPAQPGVCTASVPAGPNDANTRLVVEYVSLSCNMTPSTENLNFADVQTTLNGQGATHYLNVTDHGGGTTAALPQSRIFSIGQVVRFSHDWQSPLFFQVGSNINGSTAIFSCDLHLDGQRVKP